MIFGFLLHAVYSTIVAYILAMVFGAVSPWVAGLSLVLGTGIAWWHARDFLAADPRLHFRRFSPGAAGVMEIALGLFILFAAYRHFMWMLFPSDFFWSTLSLNNLGDLPLHINFIRAMAGGLSFPPHNPIFASELLRYPYGADLYSALWEALGVRLQAHIFVVGMFSTLASLTLLRRFGSWWAMGAFFLSGGIAGWSVLGGAPLANFNANVEWKNLFLTVFITQRGMLIALPLGLWLLVTVRSYFLGEMPLSKRQLMSLGICWGFLPLFHLHAFLIISLMLIFIAFECGGWSGVKALLWSRITQIAVLPASAFILFSTNLFRAAGVAHWQLGWTHSEGASKNTLLISFLFSNFGPWLLLPFFLAAAIFYSEQYVGAEKRKKLFVELGVYTFLFVLFMNLMLAPWAWDNIKLLIWPYLGFARLSWIVLEPRLGAIIGFAERPIVATVLFLSGIATILYTLLPPSTQLVTIFPFGVLANAEGALSGIEQNAVFAAAPTYAHPLAYFGRMRVLGYLGHVASHGISSGEVEGKLKRIMDGDVDSLRLAQELKINYIFWGPDERATYGDRERFWMKELSNVSRVPGYEIYAVK